jgi:hypothetical protein
LRRAFFYVPACVRAPGVSFSFNFFSSISVAAIERALRAYAEVNGIGITQIASWIEEFQPP